MARRHPPAKVQPAAAALRPAHRPHRASHPPVASFAGPQCRHNINAPQPPQLIAAGARSVWAISSTDSFCGRLSQIDARTNRVTHAITPRHAYYALAAAPGGLWGVTRRGARYERGRRVQHPAAVHRIGVRDGRPAAVTPLPEGELRGFAVSHDAVWISHTDHDRRGGVLR